MNCILQYKTLDFDHRFPRESQASVTKLKSEVEASKNDLYNAKDNISEMVCDLSCMLS